MSADVSLHQNVRGADLSAIEVGDRRKFTDSDGDNIWATVVEADLAEDRFVFEVSLLHSGETYEELVDGDAIFPMEDDQ